MSAFGHLNKVLDHRSASEMDYYWFTEDGAVTMGRQLNTSAVKLEKFRLFTERFPEFPPRRLQQIITMKIDQSHELVVEMANTDDQNRKTEINLILDNIIAEVITTEAHEAELEISKQRIARITAETRKFEKVISDDELRQLGRLANNSVIKSQPRTVRSFLRPMAP